MRILVAGATGAAGRLLAEQLLERGWRGEMPAIYNEAGTGESAR